MKSRVLIALALAVTPLAGLAIAHTEADVAVRCEGSKSAYATGVTQLGDERDVNGEVTIFYLVLHQDALAESDAYQDNDRASPFSIFHETNDRLGLQPPIAQPPAQGETRVPFVFEAESHRNAFQCYYADDHVYGVATPLPAVQKPEWMPLVADDRVLPTGFAP